MKKVLFIIVIASLMLISAGDTLAGSKTALIHINAKVLPIAKHTILHQESNFIVTRADIERGYVDIQKAMILSIKTNSINGYLLVFSAGKGLFSKLKVLDGNNLYNLPGTGGEVHMPYQGMNYVTKQLRFRFHLLPNLRPGIYEWPVALMISTI